jgi:hypothetical protein
MWSGTGQSGGVWQLPPHLDIGRDDYFQHGRPCLDASKSVFMNPSSPDATPPPGWSAVTSARAEEGDEVVMCMLTPNPTDVRIRRR